MKIAFALLFSLLFSTSVCAQQYKKDMRSQEEKIDHITNTKQTLLTSLFC
jgi:hypothetical protein